MRTSSPLAPREVFEQILQYMPIPTFDVIVEFEGGVVVVKRTIAPYQNVWALPGLRMLKGESIDDTILRVVKQELGINIDPSQKRLLGQFVGKFKTEENRQDISTCYVVSAPPGSKIVVNPAHFSAFRVIQKPPTPIGAMYKYYLEKYFTSHSFAPSAEVRTA